MKKIIAVFFIIAGITLGFGQDKNKSVSFEVKGNCWMCKNRIEKTAIKMQGVKFASWNADTKVFKAIIDERKCTISSVQKKIAEVGHDTGDFKSTDEVYNNLPACCQYRNPESSNMDHGKH
ncbi:metal transporter [uncultured Allomuricauda sp.]|uniref:heavy-metal-associated domain-containing protein n=1 Tax=Flagellimonas sp. W118 TaxID=3410791 RepID=UPI00260A95ED|nr:metal transporter [uncultured Allomuricauda sp.]